ncbi:MAG: DoxX family protein [Bacteroides sp.]
METKQLNRVKAIWTNICRFVLAFVFIFSGFVKAVDPFGTQYKIQDYLEAFGMTAFFPSFFPFFGSVMLFTVEFTLGIYFLFGIRRRLGTSLMLVFMTFMTVLTLYLAIKNPVSDCGCFGDAFTLTNWQTFWKNMVLFIAAISTFVWGNFIIRLVSEKLQWLISLYTLIFILGVSFYCVAYLPIFDFRPYKVGTSIPQGMAIPDDAKRSVYESVFILEKDGIKKEFTLANYPDSTWTFVDSRSLLIEKGYEPAIHDFSVVRTDDQEDITEQILQDKGYTFLLIAPRIEEADDSNIDLINEIYDYSVERGYSFYCLTSSPVLQMEQWRDKTGAEYPFCETDVITLKTIVRSNPGLVLIKDGVILNKWSRSDLPDEYVLTDKLDKLELGILKPRSVLYTILMVVLWFAVPLLFFLGIDILWVKRRNKKKAKKENGNEEGNDNEEIEKTITEKE